VRSSRGVPAPARGPRRGFTLVELTAALAVGALVALLAYRICAGVLDGTQRVLAAREALDRAANARRVLGALVEGLEVGVVPGGGFEGSRSQVTFTTWVTGPRGWAERRRVTVHAGAGRLVVDDAEGRRLEIADGVAALEVDYLLEFGAAERWGSMWMSEVSAPVALRLRVARAAAVDTLLLLVGPRG